MHQAESSSSSFCLWTGLSLPAALHPASRRRSCLPLRTDQCFCPMRTFTPLLVRTFRRTSITPSAYHADGLTPGPFSSKESTITLSDFAKPLATVRISEEGSSFAKASTGHVVEQLRLQINVHLPWSSTLTSLHNGSRCAQSSSCSIFFF